MASHVKILGILHIIFGSLGIVCAVLILAIFGGVAGLVGASADSNDNAAAIGIIGIIAAVVFFILLVLSLPGLIAGIGLVKFRPWGRILGIIISGLDLIHVPLGTALGVYGLWVLLSNETEALFRNPPPAYLTSGPAGPASM